LRSAGLLVVPARWRAIMFRVGTGHSEGLRCEKKGLIILSLDQDQFRGGAQ
jgi:hypothetical protein